MPRVDLRVPFDEKDEAKRLGARWDVDAKVWYVPDGVDPDPFEEWIPEPIDTTVNIRCNRFFIAEGAQKCWKCEKNTRVFSFLLPQGHDALQPTGEYFEGQWIRHEHEVMLWQVTWLCDTAVAAMGALTDRYFIATSTHDDDDGPATKYFSHCDHCGMKQADGGAFNDDHALQTWNPEEVRKIRLRYTNRPLEASCHDTDVVHFFDHMKLVHLDEPDEVGLRHFLVP